MEFFYRMQKESSFYMKEVTFFELDEGFIPNCVQLFDCSFFVLFSTFSVPQQYFTHTMADIYFFVQRILLQMCKDFRFIPNSSHFSCVRKNTQTEKQTNKQTFDTRIEERILFLCRADIIWRCPKIYPQQFAIFICAEIKQTDKQINKQTFYTRLCSENKPLGTLEV